MSLTNKNNNPIPMPKCDRSVCPPVCLFKPRCIRCTAEANRRSAGNSRERKNGDFAASKLEIEQMEQDLARVESLRVAQCEELSHFRRACALKLVEIINIKRSTYLMKKHHFRSKLG